MKHFEVECFRFDESSFYANTLKVPLWTLKSCIRWIRRNPQHQPIRINHVSKDPTNKHRYLRRELFVYGADGVWHTPVKKGRGLHRLDLKTGKVQYWKALP